MIKKTPMILVSIEETEIYGKDKNTGRRTGEKVPKIKTIFLTDRFDSDGKPVYEVFWFDPSNFPEFMRKYLQAEVAEFNPKLAQQWEQEGREFDGKITWRLAPNEPKA